MKKPTYGPTLLPVLYSERVHLSQACSHTCIHTHTEVVFLRCRRLVLLLRLSEAKRLQSFNQLLVCLCFSRSELDLTKNRQERETTWRESSVSQPLLILQNVLTMCSLKKTTFVRALDLKEKNTTTRM